MKYFDRIGVDGAVRISFILNNKTELLGTSTIEAGTGEGCEQEHNAFIGIALDG